jgi:SecD/SecF fusion protein
MQLKGLVKFFTAALILISLYQLSFTWVAKNFEGKAKNQAEKWVKANSSQLTGVEFENAVKNRQQEILDSLSGTSIYNIPLLKKYTYQEVKEQELNLGLDLQGGMNVTLEVSLDELIRNMSNNPKDVAMNVAIAEADKMKANSQSDFVTLFGDAYLSKNPNGKLATLFATPNRKDITLASSNKEVLAVMKREAKDAITRTYRVLLTRIDKFGVAQPSINLDENKGIITVELAGVSNPERVRKYLQSTAKLEFWEVWENNQQMVQHIVDADKALKASLNGKPLEPVTAEPGKDSIAIAKADSTGKDTTAVAAVPAAGDTVSLLNRTAQTTTAAAGADSNAVKAAKAEQENPLLSVLQMAVNYQSGEVNQVPYLGYVMPKDTHKLNQYLEMDAVRNIFPKNVKFMYGGVEGTKKNDRNAPLALYAIKTVPGSEVPRLEGDRVVEARQDFDMNGRPEISMTMNSQGAREWQRLTGQNIGKYVAIVLDDVVYSAPRVNDEISGGRSSITGSYTVEEAQDMANILKSGKLPAPAQIVQEQVVGPTLGKESIAAGMKSFAISFVVIFALMLLYYNTSGWVANIALILNLLFTVGVLSALGATLTMPGIAGLVLTIGMAVDTNVIIFERIKDELDKGKAYGQAVIDGYKHAMAPVLDGHITNLLTAVILFYFGLGPVLGFATTQILGLLLSLFCGIFVSRLVTDIWTKKNRHFEYFTPISRRIFHKANFKFIENRKIAYIISAVVIFAGVASFFHGFNEGVDFSGGRSYTIRFDQPVKTDAVRHGLQKHLEEYPVVKTIGNSNQLNITTTYMITTSGKDVDQQVEAKVFEGLKAEGFIPASVDYATFDTKYKMSSQTVLPTISDDLKAGAVKATLLSLLAIFVYIFIRFRRWQYSVGTIFSLLHDVMVTLAVFSFLKDVVPFALEIDQHFIAAILTVIGFSMNDTVIVFDRVRENFRLMPGANKAQVINKSINETLSRTIMTSLTVFLTILILFIFGGEVTRGFAFAMLIGVLTGTYSSIFVAAPVLVDMDKGDKLAQEEDKSERIKELKKMA